MNLFESKLKKYIINFFIISIIYCIILVYTFNQYNATFYLILFSITLFVNILFLSFYIYTYRLKMNVALLLLRLYLVTMTFLIYASLFHQEIKNLNYFFSYFFVLAIVYLFFGKKTVIYWAIGVVVLILIKILYFYLFNITMIAIPQITIISPMITWIAQIFNVVLVYFIFKAYKYINIYKLHKKTEKFISSKTDKEKNENNVIALNDENTNDTKLYEIYQNIIMVIENQELYLDKNFNMTVLSLLLNSNINYISKAINKYYPEGFSDLINKYRIDYFKKMVEENKHKDFKLNYMFSKSGFKNQSTFNKAFKKIEQTTPSEYIILKNNMIMVNNL